MDERAITIDESTNQLARLFSAVTRSMVDQPERVKIEVLKEGETRTLRLSVDPDDVGQVVGKQGRTARSLRCILGAMSMKLQHRISLDIVAGRNTRALPNDR